MQSLRSFVRRFPHARAHPSNDPLPPAPQRRKARGHPELHHGHRAQSAYFGIHNQSNCLPNPVAHRHEYFQIYVNLRGETTHYIGDQQRSIRPGTVSFVLPFVVHYIPNQADGQFYVINISKEYLLPSLDLDVFALSDVPLAHAPELAPSASSIARISSSMSWTRSPCRRFASAWHSRRSNRRATTRPAAC